MDEQHQEGFLQKLKTEVLPSLRRLRPTIFVPWGLAHTDGICTTLRDLGFSRAAGQEGSTPRALFSISDYLYHNGTMREFVNSQRAQDQRVLFQVAQHLAQRIDGVQEATHGHLWFAPSPPRPTPEEHRRTSCDRDSNIGLPISQVAGGAFVCPVNGLIMPSHSTQEGPPVPMNMPSSDDGHGKVSRCTTNNQGVSGTPLILPTIGGGVSAVGVAMPASHICGGVYKGSPVHKCDSDYFPLSVPVHQCSSSPLPASKSCGSDFDLIKPGSASKKVQDSDPWLRSALSAIMHEESKQGSRVVLFGGDRKMCC